MAMTLGSASVDNDGNVTKSGVIGRCYDEIYANTAANIQGGFPLGATGTTFKRAIATQATNLGTALFKVLTLDAQAKIATSSSGLQRMPASTAETRIPKPHPSTNSFRSFEGAP